MIRKSLSQTLNCGLIPFIKLSTHWLILSWRTRAGHAFAGFIHTLRPVVGNSSRLVGRETPPIGRCAQRTANILVNIHSKNSQTVFNFVNDIIILLKTKLKIRDEK